MNIRSESHTKPVLSLSKWSHQNAHYLFLFAPSREPLVPQGARRGLIDLARRRKGAKKKMRESDYSKKHTPSKKSRKTQEVDTESVYLRSPRDVKNVAQRMGRSEAWRGANERREQQSYLEHIMNIFCRKGF